MSVDCPLCRSVMTDGESRACLGGYCYACRAWGLHKFQRPEDFVAHWQAVLANDKMRYYHRKASFMLDRFKPEPHLLLLREHADMVVTWRGPLKPSDLRHLLTPKRVEPVPEYQLQEEADAF